MLPSEYVKRHCYVTLEADEVPGALRLALEELGEDRYRVTARLDITDLGELARLRPCADDPGFRDAFGAAKRSAKSAFADWLRSTSGQSIDPESIFDSQVKRIHEYKRQLLNALRIVVLYNRLRENPSLEMWPRTFLFAGKAAPAYHLAKVIIKFLNNLAVTIDADPAVRGRIKVVFLPEYSVSLAERLIPATDVSNQISTAGYEASGTSNMKFMMNGALTIGTRDGATIEMAQEAGEENFFLFGLTAEQVADGGRRGSDLGAPSRAVSPSGCESRGSVPTATRLRAEPNHAYKGESERVQR